MTSKVDMDLQSEISKILIPTDYHTEDHQNIPATSWSYTREGINFVINQLLALIKKHEREVLEDYTRSVLEKPFQPNYMGYAPKPTPKPKKVEK